jgi:acetolactate synthase-1/2/3 large subunit
MVRQWQELFFAERYSEIDLSDNPDFAALARVFGIPARRVERRAEVDDALAELLAQPGPALLHVAIDVKANVWPLVPPNQANSAMLESNPAKPDPEPSNPEPSNHALPA